MRKKLKLTKNEGSATIEAVVGFTAFLFTVVTILNIVNVCRAQAIISNAIDTTAKELSQYSYFYQISGLSKINEKFKGQGEVGTNELNTIAEGFDGLMGSISDASDSVKKTAGDATKLDSDTLDTIKSDLSSVRGNIGAVKTNIEKAESLGKKVMDNPMDYLKYIIAVAGNTALDTAVSHYIAAPLSKSMTLKHFGETTEEADAYLRSLRIDQGVEGLNFNMSTMFAKGSTQELHINCVYKIKVYSLFKGLELDAICSKSAVARAWLGGDAVKDEVKLDDNEKLSPKEDDPQQTKTGDEGAENEPASEPTPAGKTGAWAMSNSEKMDAFDEQFKNEHTMYRDTIVGGTYARYEFDDGKRQIICGYTVEENADSFNIQPEYVKMMIDSYNKLKANNQPAKEDTPPTETNSVNFIPYTLTVYVPENMSEADKAKINKKLKDSEPNFTLQGLIFDYKIVPAGGNYDYPVE